MKETKSAGGVVLNNEGLVLVVSQGGTSWSLPKGHIEEGEDVLVAAKREIHEESGITDLELIRDLGNYQRTAIDRPEELKTIYIFLFKTNEIELKPVDSHNPEARWIEKEKVAELLTHPKDKEFFVSILEQL